MSPDIMQALRLTMLKVFHDLSQPLGTALMSLSSVDRQEDPALTWAYDAVAQGVEFLSQWRALYTNKELTATDLNDFLHSYGQNRHKRTILINDTGGDRWLCLFGTLWILEECSSDTPLHINLKPQKCTWSGVCVLDKETLFTKGWGVLVKAMDHDWCWSHSDQCLWGEKKLKKKA